MNTETAELNEIDVTRIEDVKPHKDKILVYPVPLDEERTLPSGIIIPDTQREFHDKPRWGTVLAIGSEVKDVKPGQNVLIQQGCGWLMDFQDTWDEEIKEYMFLQIDHIMAVLKAYGDCDSYTLSSEVIETKDEQF